MPSTRKGHGVASAWPAIFNDPASLRRKVAVDPALRSMVTPWNGHRDHCVEVGAASPRPPDAATSLLQTPLPRCGLVAFYHLPKASGSSLECFLGAQPEFACCLRGTCGYCRTWKKRSPNDWPHWCQHRGLIPEQMWKHFERVNNRSDNKGPATFLLPDDLLRWDNAMLYRLNFRVTVSFHSGPVNDVPGMHTRASSALRFAFLRDRVFAKRGCTLVLATLLRHPVAQLISAWEYVHGRPNGRAISLVDFAVQHRGSLLGIWPTLFRHFDETFGAHQYGQTAMASALGTYAARTASAANPSATLNPLLDLFNVVGHVERFDESLLLLIDAAGLQEPRACARPINVQSCDGACPTNASRWDAVAAAVPKLVEWYASRLTSFDASIADKGDRFRARVRLLSELRSAEN